MNDESDHIKKNTIYLVFALLDSYNAERIIKKGIVSRFEIWGKVVSGRCHVENVADGKVSYSR